MSDRPDRYARQVRALGRDAHRRIRDAKVLVVGLGGLGCPAAAYLCGAGIGTIGLCDHDAVALSNLPRQTLYTADDVGRAKVDAARARLEAMNPDCVLLAMSERVWQENASLLVRGFDVVLDCTDSMDARYALSDACAAAGIRLVQGGIAAGEGQVALLCGPDGPCYRCLHPAAAEGPTCAEEGVVGPLAGLVGSLQALWTLRLVAAADAPQPGDVLLVDARGIARSIALKRRPRCEAHVQTPSPATRGAQPSDASSPSPLAVAGEGPACPLPWNAPQGPDIGVEDFAAHRDEFFLLDVREPDEHEEFAIAGDHLIPLRDLPRRVGEVPRDRNVVVYCAVGGRSGRAAAWLREQGFNAHNLRGGVRAWAMAGLA